MRGKYYRINFGDYSAYCAREDERVDGKLPTELTNRDLILIPGGLFKRFVVSVSEPEVGEKNVFGKFVRA